MILILWIDKTTIFCRKKLKNRLTNQLKLNLSSRLANISQRESGVRFYGNPVEKTLAGVKFSKLGFETTRGVVR